MAWNREAAPRVEMQRNGFDMSSHGMAPQGKEWFRSGMAVKIPESQWHWTVMSSSAKAKQRSGKKSNGMARR